MVPEVPDGSLFLETGEKYITVKYLRTAVGLPGTDPPGTDVERGDKCQVQESDPDRQLPAPFHFYRMSPVRQYRPRSGRLGGIINQLIAAFGFDKIQFMVLPEWFRTIFTASGIWQTCGWTSIIYLSALTSVDQEILEAAMIDGANRFQRIKSVTLPSIAPTISIMLIMQIGRLMSLGYEKIILLYNGSTYETADIISTYVYRRGILSADFSYSTAVGLFQSVIGVILLVTSNQISKKLSDSSLW